MARLTKNQAEALWQRLYDNLFAAEETIKEIIATRAWEPLGYASFVEAWSVNLTGLTLASEIRKHVVYQLLDDGLDHTEVARSVKGVAPGYGVDPDRQRRIGIAPEDATIVRQHERCKPSRPGTVHVEVGETILVEYQRIAKKLGLTVEGIAKKAIADRFAALVAAV